ncbi:chromosome partitioning protein ParB [Maritimibacter sp. 55A14]|uniref:ParB/RepB/Spo0J family partition protein n=1 Tax=Maritimibacter sp. 55A14 TaxID=2174844 RepID=UPI000D60B37C|nr:ParB N-terminal domain-containing protein [Maritimibacter sp. 55A14]PWE32915.1 chromosome partitioning protein ParB [Maritimibacter sp. 55A14]
MAKRRRLEAPSADELKELEEGFARETPHRDPMDLRPPPIAQVAGDAAAHATAGSVEDRTAQARDAADAGRFRAAAEKGLILRELPVAEIVADELTRDRIAMDPAEMAELKSSIAAHGLRLPVEVFELPEPDAGRHYGLISGYRRLAAVQALHAETADAAYATIRALVRRHTGITAAYVAMVEENEVRADLSQYERGRIAVLAAGQGAYDGVEAAVDGLFSSASKAKRSKIRSFALIHEELGDMLAFPTQLSERNGLRLAQALRVGAGPELRGVLASGQGTGPEEEWTLMEPLIRRAEVAARDPSRGGRPKSAPVQTERHGRIALANGMAIEKQVDDRGYAIRFFGEAVDSDLLDTVMAEIQRLLEPVD